LNNIVVSNYSNINYNDSYNISLYFSHDYVYSVFKEIKQLLISDSYFVNLDNINNVNYGQCITPQTYRNLHVKNIKALTLL
jgi:hypothetical protein